MGPPVGVEEVGLPAGVVGVADRERLPVGGVPGPAGLVGGVEVAEERPVGRFVGSDVVHDERQDRVVGSEPEERRLDRRFGGEIEFPLGQLLELGFQLRFCAVAHPQRNRAGSQDVLVGIAVVVGEDGAQRGVPFDDVGQGRFQRRNVEDPPEADGQGNVVRRGRALQPVQEPQPGLGGREGVSPVGRRREAPQRRPGRPLERAGQRRHGGPVEDRPERQLGTQGGSHVGHEPGGEQRVSAEGEEVVVGADAARFEVEQFGEQRGEVSSAAPDGSRPVPAVRSGAGRVRRSSLLLAVNGKAGSTTTAAGTM